MGRDQDRLLRSRLRDVFVVTLTDGSAWKGVLFAVDDRSIVLKEAHVLNPDQSGSPVDGELMLARDRIAYMQRP